MSLPSIGEVSNSRRTNGRTNSRTSQPKGRSPAKNRLRDAVYAIVEPLEARQLLNAAVVGPATQLGPQGAPLAPKPGQTFYVSRSGGTAWNQDSAITPNTQNDLVLNVAPFDSNYNACCEGGGGSLNGLLMTNGLTQSQVKAPPTPLVPAIGDGGVSDPSNNLNVISDVGTTYYFSYHLGTAGGQTANATGYDVSEIDVITGHQDYRVQMTADIQVQYANSTDWVSLSNSQNFQFTQVNGSGMSGGAAQMAIVNTAHPGTAIATNVVNLKFAAVNGNPWYRELVVTGTSSTGKLPIASPPHMTGATFDGANQAVDISFTNTATDSTNNPFYYQVQRAVTPNGPWLTIGSVPQQDPGATVNFVDAAPAPNAIYYYRAAAFTPANKGQFVNSDNITAKVITPPLKVEAHYYNQAYWEGPVAESTGALAVNFSGNPAPGIIRGSSNSAVFTGKVQTTSAGIYTFEGNSDDDGFLYVDGVLVSADPGGHGQELPLNHRDAAGVSIGSIFPISLAANTSYDFVFLQVQQGGGEGGHLEWITPTMVSNGITTPVLVPPSSFSSAISDAPAAPTGLAITGSTSHSVDFTFNANNNAVVHYILQRQAFDPVAKTWGDWSTVNQIDPGSNGFVNVNQPNNSVTMKIQDGSPLPGVSYQYRVAALNYDGVLASPSNSDKVTLGAPPDLVNPTAPATASLVNDAQSGQGLAAGTYYVQYTWINSANQETAASPEQMVVVPTSGASDIAVTIPTGTLAVTGNVYVSTASGQELLFGGAKAGQAVTINALPAPSANPVPTTSSTGLPAGNYWVEFSWVGPNGTGETAAGGENVFVLPGSTDLSVTVPNDAVPAGVTRANVYVGSTSGGETFAGSVAPGGTIVFNNLPGGAAAPTWNSTFAPSNVPTALTIASGDNNDAIHNNVLGVEARYYNQQLVDPNRLGHSQDADKFNVALNGIVSEYTTLSSNTFGGLDTLGGTYLFAGAIDYNWSSQPTNIGGVNGSFNTPDATLYPDIERIHNTDQTSLFTGQIVAQNTGVYTLITNTDDDGFLWLNDQLISADPNGHGQQDANNTRTYSNGLNDSLTPVTLQAGQHYNFVMIQQEGGGGSGAHLKWIEPPIVAPSSNAHVVVAQNCTNTSGATITLDSHATKSYLGYTVYITGGKGAGEKAVIRGDLGTNSQGHEYQVNVTAGGNRLLWNTIPDSSSTYAIAWESGIPVYGGGNNPATLNEGLLQYMDAPHLQTYNSDGTINQSDFTKSAAQNVVITNVDPTNGATLTWTDGGASELWFEVQRSSDNGTTWATVGKTPMIIGTSFTDPGAANAADGSHAYQYRVRGVNFDGSGPWSPVVATNTLPAAGAPSINSVVQGDPGTIGLTFGGQSPFAGGLHLQMADVTGGATPVWADVTRNPLPSSTFDFLVTGLKAADTYQFRVSNAKTSNQVESAFSAIVTVNPVGATAEAIGTPGALTGGYANGAKITGQFTSAGDLQLNGGAGITSAFPAAPTPTTLLSHTTASDVQNPTANDILFTSLVASPGAPAPLPTSAVSLTPGTFGDEMVAGTYFLKYTWQGANGGETTASSEVTINTMGNQIDNGTGSGSSTIIGDSGPIGTTAGKNGDLVITLPSGQANAGKVNVYVSFSQMPYSTNPADSASGKEQLIGSYSQGSTLTLTAQHDPLATGNQFAVGFPGTPPGNGYPSGSLIPSNAVTVPTTDTTGLAPGTYYMQYTWTGAGGETAPSPEQTVVIPAGNPAGINVTLPAAPPGAGTANLYVGTSSGSEQLFGAVTGGKSTLVRTLPGTGAATPPAVNTIGLPVGTYQVQYSWNGSYNGDTREGLPSATVPVTLSTQGDILLTIPAAPAGAGNANVYVGNSLANPTTAATVASANSGGNLAGGQTLYVNYEWVNGAGATMPATETTIVTAADKTTGTHASNVTVTTPAVPFGATGARIFIGAASGKELLAGTAGAAVGSAANLTITALPSAGTQGLDTVNTAGPTFVGNAKAGSTLTVRNLNTSKGGPDPFNPTNTPATVTTVADVANPTAKPTVASAAKMANTTGLPAGTYFIEYTYTSANGETTPGATETTFVLASTGSVNVTVPAGPAGVTAATVYIGTTSGGETYGGASKADGTTAVNISALPLSGSATPPAASSSGLPAGTYYLKYTWTGSPGYRSETVASAEQTVVVNGTSQDLVVTVPEAIGETGANVFISNHSGQEVLAGGVSAGQPLTIASLPDPVASRLAPANRWSDLYYTPANALQLAPNVNGTTSSAFQGGQDINGFNTSFDFIFTGNAQADGFAFVIQPDSQGQIGGGGGSLGYDGTGHSVAVYFQMYGSSQTGIGIDGNRQNAINTAGSGISWSWFEGPPNGGNTQNKGDVYNATLSYNASTKQLTEVLTDETKMQAGIPAVFTQVYNIDIVAAVGMKNAFVGFTGANGGAHSEKDILNWSFQGGLGNAVQSNIIDLSLAGAGSSISLTKDTSGNVDWTINGQQYFMSLADPTGLTIKGNGAADSISFADGSVIPNKLILGANTGGSFTLNGVTGADPLAGKTLDIGKNTVFISYATGADPIASIQSHLKAGYANGWAAGTVGGIDSSAVASNSGTSIGYADSADGTNVDAVANTIEMRYTLAGDANLDGKVDFNDLAKIGPNYAKTGVFAWDQGDFTYDGKVDFNDLAKVGPNYGKTLS